MLLPVHVSTNQIYPIHELVWQHSPWLPSCGSPVLPACMFLCFPSLRCFQAALATMRILRKVPDLTEMFVRAVRPLLNEKKHGKLACWTFLLV